MGYKSKYNYTGRYGQRWYDSNKRYGLIGWRVDSVIKILFPESTKCLPCYVSCPTLTRLSCTQNANFFHPPYYISSWQFSQFVASIEISSRKSSEDIWNYKSQTVLPTLKYYRGNQAGTGCGAKSWTSWRWACRSQLDQPAGGEPACQLDIVRLPNQMEENQFARLP